MDNQNTYKPTDSAGKLAQAFIRSPLTIVLGVFLLALGYLSLIIMPREENPQMVVSGSTVIVALPGASAEQIQKVIVRPLERKMKEVKGVEHISGMAMDNVGIVNAAFYIGEIKADSNLKVYDKIMQNYDIFPAGTMNPIIKPLDIDIDIPIVSVAFYSNNNRMSKTELYDAVKDIQHHINGLPNVAITEIKGGNKTQFNVEVDINKLSGYNLSMGQIMKAVQSLSYNVPAIKNTTDNNEIIIMGVKNAIESVKDIDNIIVAQYMGSPIYLHQVAKVSKSYDIQNFKSTLISLQQNDGVFSPLQDQVTLTVSKLQGTNAVLISEAVKTELETYRDYLAQNGINYVITRNDGERANHAVNELVYHLVLSIVIIAVLLVLVLGWRESLIVTFTVPAILAITLFVAYLTGQTINRITLFAFLLSLGLLVDAAIIVIENIHRHLHSMESINASDDDLMVKATDEIGPPTNIATLAIIMTMVPMAFVGQMMGQFMKPIPANVPVALIASLFVAYIFTPYLAVRMLKRPDHGDGEHTNHANHPTKPNTPEKSSNTNFAQAKIPDATIQKTESKIVESKQESQDSGNPAPLEEPVSTTRFILNKIFGIFKRKKKESGSLSIFKRKSKKKSSSLSIFKRKSKTVEPIEPEEVPVQQSITQIKVPEVKPMKEYEVFQKQSGKVVKVKEEKAIQDTPSSPSNKQKIVGIVKPKKENK